MVELYVHCSVCLHGVVLFIHQQFCFERVVLERFLNCQQCIYIYNKEKCQRGVEDNVECMWTAYGSVSFRFQSMLLPFALFFRELPLGLFTGEVTIWAREQLKAQGSDPRP
jgi:hypothetical protein